MPDVPFAEIILLDDPLSALDVHTGKKVFHQLLGPSGLLQDRTRVLVTHAVQFLGECSKVFVLYNGSTIFRGHYDQLLEHAAAYTKEFEATASSLEDGSEGRAGVSALLQSLTNSAQEQNETDASEVTADTASAQQLTAQRNDMISVDDFVDANSGEETVKIRDAEGIATGGVGIGTTCYWAACCGGICYLGTYFSALVLERTLCVFHGCS